MQTRFGANHPSIKQMEHQIKFFKELVASKNLNVITAEQKKIQSLQQQMQRMADLVKQVEDSILQLQQTATELKLTLESSPKLKSKFYDTSKELSRLGGKYIEEIEFAIIQREKLYLEQLGVSPTAEKNNSAGDENELTQEEVQKSLKDAFNLVQRIYYQVQEKNGTQRLNRRFFFNDLPVRQIEGVNRRLDKIETTLEKLLKLTQEKNAPKSTSKSESKKEN